MIENDEKSSSSTPVVIDIDTTELEIDNLINEATGPSTHERCEPADAFIYQDEDLNLTDSGHMEQTPLTYSTIKKVLMKNANEIRTRYQNNQKISTEERKLMSCGSSLTLDISDKSESNIYKSLFSVIDWNKIVSNFENNLVLPKAEIDKNMLVKWDYATDLAMLSNDIEGSQIYFASQFAASISKKQRSIIKLFIVILDVFQNNAFIMKQKHPDSISEGDYVDQIWLLVLKSLFAINGQLIRVKKVDVCLTYDHGASESDIDVAEACLPEVDNSKVIDDSAKLLREEKDNTDTLIKVTSGDIHNSWIMQISGLMAYIPTVNYVGVLQNIIVFPSCIGELNDQAKSLEFFNGLLQLRNSIENSAQMIKARIFQANKSNTNISTKYHDLGFTTPLHTQQLSCQTWYTPPRKQQKRSAFPEANYELLETGKYAVVDDDTDANPPNDDDSENAKEDAFGFVKRMNGWYHPGLKKYFDQRPCEWIDC
ncbi:hypothetical protein RMATCC62417_13004 [Rhizopus microsporus]|nr:hypothetical protein RMATCC62417_13004 [Rhizopus microsporus]